MDCGLAQQEILAAEDIAGDFAAPAELAGHVSSCAECQALIARLRRLEGMARELPVPGGHERAPEEFLRRVARMPAAAPRPARAWTMGRFNRVAAAAILLIVGLTALSLCLFSGPSARAAGVLDDLVAWNVQLTQSHDPAERARIYQGKAQVMRERVAKASLNAADEKIAQTLLANAQWLTTENSRLDEAQHFSQIADALAAQRRASADPAASAQWERLARNLDAQAVKPNLQEVDADHLAQPDKDRWKAIQNQVEQRAPAGPAPAGEGPGNATGKSAWTGTAGAAVATGNMPGATSRMSGGGGGRPVSPAVATATGLGGGGSAPAPVTGGAASDFAKVNTASAPVENETASSAVAGTSATADAPPAAPPSANVQSSPPASGSGDVVAGGPAGGPNPPGPGPAAPAGPPVDPSRIWPGMNFRDFAAAPGSDMAPITRPSGPDASSFGPRALRAREIPLGPDREALAEMASGDMPKLLLPSRDDLITGPLAGDDAGMSWSDESLQMFDRLDAAPVRLMGPPQIPPDAEGNEPFFRQDMALTRFSAGLGRPDAPLESLGAARISEVPEPAPGGLIFMGLAMVLCIRTRRRGDGGRSVKSFTGGSSRPSRTLRWS